MSRAKRIIPVVLGAALLALAFLPRKPLVSEDPFAASGVVLRAYTGAGDLSWEVRAKSGEVVDEEGTLRDVIVRFLSEDNVDMTAIAERFVQGEAESTLSGGVRIERDDGLRLETEEMSWNERKELLEAGPVELEVRDLLISGDSFEYDLPGERATILGAIRVVDSSGDERYSCERIEADDDSVRLSGSVAAEFPDGSLEADNATIDESGLTAAGNVSLRLDLATSNGED